MTEETHDGKTIPVDSITRGMHVKLTTRKMIFEGEVVDVSRYVIRIKQPGDDLDRPVIRRLIELAERLPGY